jgi:transcriptional regulator with XRE-family HTH domain
MEFKDVLRKLRTEKGMTQEELGRLVGLKKEAIYKYEKGIVVNPKRSLIAKLANIFNVSPSYLLGISDDEPQNKETFSDEELQLIADFRKLNKDGQNAALGVVHAYTLMESYIKKEKSAVGSF